MLKFRGWLIRVVNIIFLLVAVYLLWEDSNGFAIILIYLGIPCAVFNTYAMLIYMIFNTPKKKHWTFEVLFAVVLFAPFVVYYLL